jgi:hypothetical protein
MTTVWVYTSIIRNTTLTHEHFLILLEREKLCSERRGRADIG